MRIVRHDLSGEEIADFLGEHLRQMHELTPSESVHALDLDALRRPEVTFWAVLDDAGAIAGTGALKDLGHGHGEVKSMRTRQDLKRRGVASLLLDHIISHARETGFSQLSLETGSAAFFEPARTMYEGRGFQPCGPFGTYREDKNSAYFTLPLPQEG